MNNISTPILFKDLSAQEQMRLTRTWANNALKELAPKVRQETLSVEELEALAEYFKTNMSWESGIRSTSAVVNRFYEMTMDGCFNGILDMRGAEPKMILTSISNSAVNIITSPIRVIKILTNGYARITTDDTVYHFWNPMYGVTMQNKQVSYKI